MTDREWNGARELQLIDVNALLEVLPEIEDEYKIARKIIKEQPVIDAIPVNIIQGLVHTYRAMADELGASDLAEEMFVLAGAYDSLLTVWRQKDEERLSTVNRAEDMS